MLRKHNFSVKTKYKSRIEDISRFRTMAAVSKAEMELDDHNGDKIYEKACAEIETLELPLGSTLR